MIYLLFEWWFTYFTCRSMLDDLKVRSPVFPHYITIYTNIYYIYNIYIYPIIYWQNPVIYPWFPHYIPYDINIYIHSDIIPKTHLPKFFLNICTSFPYDITIYRVLFSMSSEHPQFPDHGRQAAIWGWTPSNSGPSQHPRSLRCGDHGKA